MAGMFPCVDPDPTESPDGGGESTEQLTDAERLKKALDAERKLNRQNAARAAQLEAQLKEVGQVDPRLLSEAQAKAEAAEHQRQLLEQQYNTRLQDADRKYQEQLSRLTAELQSKAATAEREALRVKAEREFIASEGITEVSKVDGKTPFDYVWQAFGARYGEDKNGLFLMDDDGSPALDPETGARVTLAQHYQTLRRDPVHGRNFLPEYGSGSGARAGRDGRVTTTTDIHKMGNSELFVEGFVKNRR
jgi:hypothetical protein